MNDNERRCQSGFGNDFANEAVNGTLLHNCMVPHGGCCAGLEKRFTP